MKNLIRVFIILLTIQSCSPMIDYRRLLERDIQPPVFMGIKIQKSNQAEIIFSEPVTPVRNKVTIIPEPPEFTAEPKNSSIMLNFSNALIPGGSYKLITTVEDTSGNTLTLICLFYGFNPDLPMMVINEFTTQGSTSNPDRVEIRIGSDGNTAGAVIYEGSDLDWDQRKIFPPINVKKGDFIIVHFKSSGDPEETDELTDMNESGGTKPAADAWDIWLEDGDGLSGNNGTIMLFTAPFGNLMDGLLYSNRTSESDDKYRGFGSTKVMNRADRLTELGGWVIKEELIRPEDGINPEDSTATRSMCRSSFSGDSDGKEDWHIVPTSTSTFGEVNSDLIYTP